MKFSDRLSAFGSQSAASAKSLVKVLLQSRSPSVSVARAAMEGKPLIIMGNGPSLADVIRSFGPQLAESVTMALNFAANADEFTTLRPDFYLMADPHFFEGRESDPNVGRLFSRLNSEVSWPMTLYVPIGSRCFSTSNRAATIASVMPQFFTNPAWFFVRIAMPRILLSRMCSNTFMAWLKSLIGR